MRHSEVVRQHWSATITLELAAEPRSKDDGSGERDHTADGMKGSPN